MQSYYDVDAMVDSALERGDIIGARCAVSDGREVLSNRDRRNLSDLIDLREAELKAGEER